MLEKKRCARNILSHLICIGRWGAGRRDGYFPIAAEVLVGKSPTVGPRKIVSEIFFVAHDWCVAKQQTLRDLGFCVILRFRGETTNTSGSAAESGGILIACPGCRSILYFLRFA